MNTLSRCALISGAATLAAASLLAVGPVVAHHPNTSAASICTTDGPLVEWAAWADEARGLQWRINGGAWLSDSQPWTLRQQFDPSQGGQRVSFTFHAEWSNGLSESRSASVRLRSDCVPAETTTTTEVTTTTTEPPVETTEVPETEEPTSTSTLPPAPTTLPEPPSSTVPPNTSTPSSAPTSTSTTQPNPPSSASPTTPSQTPAAPTSTPTTAADVSAFVLPETR